MTVLLYLIFDNISGNICVTCKFLSIVMKHLCIQSLIINIPGSPDCAFCSFSIPIPSQPFSLEVSTVLSHLFLCAFLFSYKYESYIVCFVIEELTRPGKLQLFQTRLRSFVLLLSEKAKHLPPPSAALGLDLRISRTWLWLLLNPWRCIIIKPRFCASDLSYFTYSASRGIKVYTCGVANAYEDREEKARDSSVDSNLLHPFK